MKMSVLYHSKSGNTKQMAQVIAEGMQSVEGIEARVFPIDAADEQFVKESRCVVVGTPTYLASLSGAVKSWLDGPCMKLALAGKIGGAYATCDYLHGGAEIAIQSILGQMLVLGMLVYSGGAAHGHPVIHLGPVAIKGKLDESAEVFRLYGLRMATKTKELFG